MELDKALALIPTDEVEAQEHVKRALDFYTGSTYGMTFSRKDQKESISWLRSMKPDVYKAIKSERESLREDGEDEVLLGQLDLAKGAQERLRIWMAASPQERMEGSMEVDGVKVNVPDDKEASLLLKLSNEGVKQALAKRIDRGSQ